MVEYVAVQADSLRFQAVMALRAIRRDWEHLFQVHQESTGTSVTRKNVPKRRFGGFLSHGGIRCCAGRFAPGPGCRGTARKPSGLGTPIPGPSGVDRDFRDPK